MRDARGRFRPKRRYRLLFDDGRTEEVRAYTPSEAVACRPRGRYSLLPHTIVDLTAIERWEEVRIAIHEGVYSDQRAPLLARSQAPSEPPRQRPFADWREEWDD